MYLGLGVLAFVLPAPASSERLAASSTQGRPAVIVFERYRQGLPTPAVWRVNRDGSAPTFLAGGWRPQVSPDGRSVAYERGDGLFVIPTAGGTPRLLLATSSGFLPYQQRAWSPDSAWVVFPAVNANRRVLVAANAHSGAILILQRFPVLGLIDGLSVSPDSRSVVYALRLHSSSQDSEDLYVTSVVAGTTARRLTSTRQAYDPVWGPSRIAYGQGEQNGDIWLIKPDGTDARQLTSVGRGVSPVAWSGDGTRMLGREWHSWIIGTPTNGETFAIDVGTGQATNLWGADGYFIPSGISEDGTTILGDWGYCYPPGPEQPLNGGVGTLPFDGQEGQYIHQTRLAVGCSPSWNG